MRAKVQAAPYQTARKGTDGMKTIAESISNEIGRPQKQVENVILLLDEGNTIPFIARYRKEAHGAMDDVLLRKLEERLAFFRGLEKRKEEVLRLIQEKGKLTEELERAVRSASTRTEVEDLYLPYRTKRKTRAVAAREKGLEPLARCLMAQKPDMADPMVIAEGYVDAGKGVLNVQEALAGASDIVAEIVSESAEIRRKMRNLIRSGGCIAASAAKEESSVYERYYGFRQEISRVQGHQILAMNRGEKEGFLRIAVQTDREAALSMINRTVIRGASPVKTFLERALEDSFDRLLFPSLVNEVRSELTETASEGAIRMFSANLKPLLMQPPVKGKVIMGLDPGYRMGCKVAVIDGTGKVLDTGVVYPTHGARQKEEAIQKLAALIRTHGVKYIAIGNGTASRETEQMTAELIRVCPGVSYMVVSEAGASVYSASELATKELPRMDVNLRSAVSIARRMEDPLAELVKIDPKSIGIGQYQHDMPQTKLTESLNAVVEDCVNSVGVDLNTASPSLLQHVAGLNASTAGSIVAYREQNGAYTSRDQLKKVPRIGEKAFEQCAGFLRIPESPNLLDRTGVHPESYAAAAKLMRLCGVSEEDVREHRTAGITDKLREAGEEALSELCGVGTETLKDIVRELMKPGRDPREELPKPIFRKDLLDLSDLKPGMELYGTVRNVVDFGAFVDIGVHQDGLVHISEISDRYIKHPSQAVKVGDEVRVIVLEVNAEKKRISLSMKQASKAEDQSFTK